MSDALGVHLGDIIAYERGELGPREVVAMFGGLIRTGAAWALQGHYGRVAEGLIGSGWLDADGNMTEQAIEWFEDEGEDE